MNGDGFQMMVKEGQEVKKGDVLVQADLEQIRKAGKDTAVIVLLTSGEKAKMLGDSGKVLAAKEWICEGIAE